MSACGRTRSIALSAVSISAKERASNTCSCMFRRSAQAQVICTELVIAHAQSTNRPSRFRFGTSSIASWMGLASVSKLCKDTPVRFPPGWARLWINPSLTGSAIVAHMIGVVCVARRAIGTAASAHKYRMDISANISAISLGSCAASPFAYRVTIVTLLSSRIFTKSPEPFAKRCLVGPCIRHATKPNLSYCRSLGIRVSVSARSPQGADNDE